ncbi:hypothetical protein JRQ81_015637, partial [Phrynocephalus forsythii]
MNKTNCLYFITDGFPGEVNSRGDNVVLLKLAAPVQVKTHLASTRIPQYPLQREVQEGIKPLLESYLAKGILECQSPYSSPIIPVKKPKPGPNGKLVYQCDHRLKT